MTALVLLVLAACTSHLPPDQAASPALPVAQPALAPIPVDDLLIDAETCGAPSSAEVSHDDLLYDLSLLQLLMEQGYAGYEPLIGAGLHWDALFAAMRAGVEDLPEPVPVPRVQDWALRYLEVTHDNHLALWRITEKGW